MTGIVLSGATGMIGTAIIREAMRYKIPVVAIVRKNSVRRSALPDSELLKVIEANLCDYATLEAPVTGYGAFLHLAWDKTFGTGRDDVDVQVQNIQYTLDAIRLAQRMGCEAFVGAGSQAEYGPVSEDLRPDTPAFPTSGYGIAKCAAGQLSRLLASQLGMRHCWVRILSIYGPGDGPRTLISYALSMLKAGNSPELTPCGQVWDYLHCDDAARAILSIAARGRDGAIYPLGSGRGKKLSSYLEAMRDTFAPSVRLGFGKKPYYPHQPMHLVADISTLTIDTGWKPEISFTEGIKGLDAAEA